MNSGRISGTTCKVNQITPLLFKAPLAILSSKPENLCKVRRVIVVSYEWRFGALLGGRISYKHDARPVPPNRR